MPYVNNWTREEKKNLECKKCGNRKVFSTRTWQAKKEHMLSLSVRVRDLECRCEECGNTWIEETTTF